MIDGSIWGVIRTNAVLCNVVSVNYMIIENLERYDTFFGDGLKVECPTGSGNLMRLGDVARELSSRLTKLFLPGPDGHRPCHGKKIITSKTRKI